MKILVGHTGFVGSNLSAQHKFDGVYHSANISDAFGTCPDLCIYAGIRSEKFTADQFPADDLNHILDALENIKKIAPKKLVLISTVDVIPSQQKQGENIYEDSQYQTEKLSFYGQNRLLLEKEARKYFPGALIVRLPALFGGGIKKNFIYDLIHFIPAMLKKAKFEELCGKAPDLKGFYKENENGFFRLIADISVNDRKMLKTLFKNLGFSAINFTDSRSKYAFYNLKYLWDHIQILLDHKITLAHMAAEPVSAAEIYNAVYGENFTNEIMAQPFDYSFFKTRHCSCLGGRNGYIFAKDQIILEVLEFVNGMMKLND